MGRIQTHLGCLMGMLRMNTGRRGRVRVLILIYFLKKYMTLKSFQSERGRLCVSSWVLLQWHADTSAVVAFALCRWGAGSAPLQNLPPRKIWCGPWPGAARPTPGCGGDTHGKLHEEKSAASEPTFSSFSPSTLPVPAAGLGLLLCASARHRETLHPAMQFQVACLQMRLGFLTHPHPAVPTSDNHSCVCKHHMLRWCLLVNISSLSTSTRHPKVGFSTWVTHPWKPSNAICGLQII